MALSDVILAATLNNLAERYKEEGRYADAEPLYKRVLAINEKARGPDHLSVALALNDLAELYRGQGRYADAEPLYKRSLAIRDAAAGALRLRRTRPSAARHVRFRSSARDGRRPTGRARRGIQSTGLGLHRWRPLSKRIARRRLAGMTQRAAAEARLRPFK